MAKINLHRLVLILAIFLILVFSVYSSSEYNFGLTRSIADKIYCQLTGCSITGDITVKALKINNQTNNGADFCTLSSGNCTINNNKVTANTIIICMAQNGAVNLGSLSISARTIGTSYTITSSNVLEADKVGCILFEPVTS